MQLERLTATQSGQRRCLVQPRLPARQADNVSDAERCFRRRFSCAPLDRAWYGLGLVLIRDGRLEEAVDALKQNIKLQPFSPYGYFQLGLTYHHLGRSDDARKCPQAAGPVSSQSSLRR